MMSAIDNLFFDKEIHIWAILSVITVGLIIYFTLELQEQHAILIDTVDCDALTVIILDKEHQYVQRIQTLATEHYFMKCV